DGEAEGVAVGRDRRAHDGRPLRREVDEGGAVGTADAPGDAGQRLGQPAGRDLVPGPLERTPRHANRSPPSAAVVALAGGLGSEKGYQVPLFIPKTGRPRVMPGAAGGRHSGGG